MRSSTFAIASLLVFAAAGGATAGSSDPASTAVAPAMTRIAMGCGVGRTRDAMGHCRRRFNLFRHHGQFQAYKKRRCDKVTTPNGAVDRCQI